jgi:ApeA N-terminal domain 1
VADEGDMARSWEWFGHFVPPGGGQDAVRPGRLSFTPQDGLTLRLIGAFNDHVLPAVHGIVEGNPVTLVDCVATSTSHRGLAAIADRQDIDIEAALFGVLLEDPNAPTFSESALELEQLSGWAAEQDMDLVFDTRDDTVSGDIDLPTAGSDAPQPYDHCPPSGDKSPLTEDQPEEQAAHPTGGRRGWGVRVEPAEERRFAQIDDELQIEMRRGYRLPTIDEYRNRIEVRTYGSSVLVARSTHARSFREWVDIARGCQDLLSLASYSSCAVLRLTLTTQLGAEEASGSIGQEVRVFIDNVAGGQPHERAVAPWKMLFTLADVDFGALMPRWFEVRNVLGPSCNMVLGLKYIPGGYLETQLLTAVGAAEVMAGALVEKKQLPLPIPRDVFPSLRQHLVEQTSTEYRTWVGNKLQNTPTLGDRLEALALIPDQSVRKALLPNVEEWARRTTKARNDLAHRGHSKGVPYLEMSAAVYVTVALVVVNLLTQLAIPPHRILQALEHHQDLQSAPLLAKKYWPERIGPQSL